MKSYRLSKALVCLLLLAGVGAFDYFTGYEVSSYPVYLMPIFLTFFYFGRNGGYVACVLSAIMWTVLDIANGHHFVHEISRYWAAFSRLGIYMMFVYGLSVYAQTVSVHRYRLEQMRRLISMCHGCGKILWRDGSWKTPEQAFEMPEGLPAECPDCSDLALSPDQRSSV